MGREEDEVRFAAMNTGETCRRRRLLEHVLEQRWIWRGGGGERGGTAGGRAGAEAWKPKRWALSPVAADETWGEGFSSSFSHSFQGSNPVWLSFSRWSLLSALKVTAFSPLGSVHLNLWEATRFAVLAC